MASKSSTTSSGVLGVAFITHSIFRFFWSLKDTLRATAAQRDTLDTDQTNSTSGLKQRVEKSSTGEWSISPSISRLNSASSKPDSVPVDHSHVDNGCYILDIGKVCAEARRQDEEKTDQSQPPICRNCYQPFLLNHRCDEGFYLDDYSQFGDSDDDGDDETKKLPDNLAFQCKCSLHSADLEDKSEQPMEKELMASV